MKFQYETETTQALDKLHMMCMLSVKRQLNTSILERIGFFIGWSGSSTSYHHDDCKCKMFPAVFIIPFLGRRKSLRLLIHNETIT